MLDAQKRLSTGFLVLLSLPTAAVGFALSSGIVTTTWLPSTRFDLHLENIALIWLMGPMAAAYGFMAPAPTNEVFFYVGMLLCGIGWSSLISIVFAICSEAVDSREMGVSMGVFNSSLVLPALAVPGLLKLSDALDQHRWVFALFALCLALSVAFWSAVSERGTGDAGACRGVNRP